MSAPAGLDADGRGGLALGGSRYLLIRPETLVAMQKAVQQAVGGLGSVPGSVLGAAVVTTLNDSLAGFQNYRPLIFGAILIVSMLFMPGGIASALRKLAVAGAAGPPRTGPPTASL